MSNIALIHITLEIWGVIFCLIAALCLYLEKSLDSKENRIMIRIQLVNAMLLLNDVLAWAFRGNEGRLGYYAVRVSNFIVFAMTILLLFTITQYISYIISRYKRSPNCSIIIRTVYIMCIIAVFLLVISQFTHLYYSFDSQNRYYRTSLYWISMIPGVLGMILDGIVIIKCRKCLTKIENVYLMSYIVIPAVASIIQFFVYGIQILNLSITISLMLMFFGTQVERSKKYIKRERALHEAEIGLMMSQIHPHFLFNCLTTIRHLCKKNPQEAIETIDEFSLFLRGSMDSVTRKTTIPFSQELEIVKNYVALEQRRFKSELEVRYDIRCDSFSVPALSIQPIVENAIRHGIRGRIGSGCVTVRTDEKEDSYIIEITDDGVGFDPSISKDDGRTHVGIENVRKRIQLMCQGTLEINSEMGKGTDILIEIPKITIQRINNEDINNR